MACGPAGRVNGIGNPQREEGNKNGDDGKIEADRMAMRPGVWRDGRGTRHDINQSIRQRVTADNAPLMINEGLTTRRRVVHGATGLSTMWFELLLAGFIMAVGLAIAGTVSSYYQWIFDTPAALRYEGKTYVHALGHLVVSFLAGPVIMLQMGWKQEDDGTLSIAGVLVSALVAFGWSFITGLFALGLYFSIVQ